MATRNRAARPHPIVPSAARELLERLTTSLEIPFTITDDKGAVVASIGGRARGQIEVNALTVLQQGSPMEVTGDSVLRWHLEGGESPSIAVEGGAFAAGAAVYLPLKVGDSAGVLIAHGEPEDVRVPARTAVPCVEVALEFARAAAVMVREGVGPDLALYRLLRGSRAEAYEAQLIAKVAGWDLRVPRAAIVAVPFRRNGNGTHPLSARMLGAVLEVLGDRAPHTPFGRLRGHEWVVLPEVEPDGKASLRALAHELTNALADNGAGPTVGIGELHDHSRTVLALRQSYREALYSARCGSRIHGEPGVYELDALGAAAFFATGRSRRRLAARLLDPLRGQQDLLDSLHAFLRANLSITDAASRAGVHRHTIRNHLERIHELTGLDPRDLDHAVQLCLALLIQANNGHH
ncbi:MAG: helix-turn-helix domain-containing protein [Gemmatimonadetes bacterium]|nr:helix-turn-helix domain-containing protein [Gemmatimonadota bacterium]